MFYEERHTRLGLIFWLTMWRKTRGAGGGFCRGRGRMGALHTASVEGPCGTGELVQE
jgi:hypothetical protein